MDFFRVLGTGFLLVISYLIFNDITLALKTSCPNQEARHYSAALRVVIDGVGAFCAGYVFLKIWEHL